MATSPDLLSASGRTLAGALEAADALSRALWQTHSDPNAFFSTSGASPQVVALHRSHVQRNLRDAIFSSPLARTPGVDPDALETILLNEIYPPDANGGIRLRYFSPLYLLKRLLVKSVYEPAEIKYALIRRLREKTRVVLSATAASMLNRLSDQAQRLACYPIPIDRLKGALSAVPADMKGPVAVLDPSQLGSDYVQLAVGIWESTGAMRPVAAKAGHVDFDAALLTREHMVATAFGLPTSIPGFDELFNGGLMLPDVPGTPLPPGSSGHLRGRTVVVTAPAGSGKTLLTLQMAIEIARKGGIAWVIALEQSPEECLYSMETLGIPVTTELFDIVMEYGQVFPVLSGWLPGRGALLLLPAVSNADFTDLVDSLTSRLPLLNAFPLRMLAVDPLSALYPTHDLRAKAVQLLRKAKECGVNVWLTSEQFNDSGASDRFEENIADTVIRMGFCQTDPERYIEVSKSRLQREKPGRHVLQIHSSGGVRIHQPPAGYISQAPSPARHRKTPLQQLGIPGLGQILEARAILDGDIIALHGATGTSKTLMSLQFLRAVEEPRNPNLRSLFIADIPHGRMQDLVREMYEHPTDGPERPERHLLTLALHPGLVDPGAVLLEIDRVLEHQQSRSKPIDRVVLVNLSRWQLSMPRVGSDSSFALALITVLRRYGVTAVLSCGSPDNEPDSLIRLLLEMSDCSLEITRAPFGGHDRYFLRALKTHHMNHRRGRFEMYIREGRVEISPRESLLRLDASGNVIPVRIVLFLHTESTSHNLHNERLKGALVTTLSDSVDIAPQSRTYDPQALRLGASSNLDEVQILQLDEFQLPAVTARPALFSFSRHTAGHLIADRLPDLRKACTGGDENAVVAVPFYANISLLARRKGVDGIPWHDWRELAKASVTWEAEHREGLYFGCHVVHGFESYNCLFLEILHSLRKPDPRSECSLLEWLSSKETPVALDIFARLLQRYHLALFRSENLQQNELLAGAMITRHWYNTLNDMLSGISASDRGKYEIGALPPSAGGRAAMTTAGEWYLAVPVYSAAPEVALDIIDYMTSPDKETERLHLGVGLPTSAGYYDGISGPATDISPYFDELATAGVNLGSLVQDAFRRSQFHCYQSFAETLGSHLRRMLEHETAIDTAYRNLLSSLAYVRSRSRCGDCRRANQS